MRTRALAAVFAALALAADTPKLTTLADVGEAAGTDIGRVPEPDRYYTRYLTLYNFAAGREREDAYRVLAKHCNDLSTEQEIRLPDVVPGTAGALLRIDLRWYNWKRSLWGQLGDFDPFLQVTTDAERVIEYQDRRGRTRVKTVIDRGVRAFSPELSAAPAHSPPGDGARRAALIGRLAEATQSRHPILRGDWFHRYTAIQDPDRKGGQLPGYYDFLGLGKRQEDFERLIGADVDLARYQFKDEVSAVVGRSKVTHQNRRLGRFGKIGGGYWFTLDARDGVERSNFLEVRDDLNVARYGYRNVTGKKGFAQVFAGEQRADATEQFGPLPNKLMAWWLANNRGVRQNTAPDFIAGNSLARGTNKRIYAGQSCLECHTDGVKPFTDWARTVFQAPLQENVKDYGAQKRERQLYLGDLDGEVRRDQEVYRAAVWRATCTPGNRDGLSTEQYVERAKWMWDRYQETDYDLARISLETGADRDTVLWGLERVARATQNTRPLFAGLLRATIRGEKEVGIRPEHWEEFFPLTMATIRGYVPVEGKAR
jgi:hypothetical protein